MTNKPELNAQLTRKYRDGWSVEVLMKPTLTLLTALLFAPLAPICAAESLRLENDKLALRFDAASGTLTAVENKLTGETYTVNCLFRRNVLLRNRSSAALWFDGFNTNTRITQNVLHDTVGSPFGSIFIELTKATAPEERRCTSASSRT